MKLNQTKKLALPALIGLALTGCGSSSSDSNNNGYIQLYNGSYNSPKTFLFIEDVQRTGSKFGAVSTRHSYQSDTYEVSYEYQNDDGDYKSIFEQDVKINSDQKQLIIMTGDFAEPTFTEISIEDVDESNSDDELFSLAFINTVGSDVNFDVYLASEDDDFTDADFVTTTTKLSASDFITYTEGKFSLYITKAGEDEVIFRSTETSLYDGISYIAIIRDVYGVTDGSITIDLVSDSNNVIALKHEDAQGQIHFYNSLNQYENVTFTATNLDNSTAPIASDSFSEYMKLVPGDYTISMTDEATGEVVIEKYLITLNREESLAAIVYQDNDRIQPSMKSITENLSPNSTSHDIQIINLINSSNGIELSQLDVFFTKSGESIEDTNTFAKNITKYQHKSVAIDNETYTIQVVFDDDGQLRSLITVPEQAFTQDGNYIIVLEEKDCNTENCDDAEFKLTIEHTVANIVE
ncbi:hypothetical protein CJF42_01450 [Pseudoalteromonas sp. NBT06-2]|uniref:hypothetical protein n=1 Tax=Pseudoalteromonas sp. NBT06-2 TaxID=2025950 RepID=UPI000BA7B8FC|nr:hypothetical protein [Pseudoalteromonas sp. NBT06-2]PAJ76171.1 hypothetical protein CJF42_01450 [Pseudoalteromonas sp. NBT06-2]